MPKLSLEQKQARTELREELENAGGFTVICRSMRMVFCFHPSNSLPRNAESWFMSSAVCNSEDKFRPKHGELLALERMVDRDCAIVSREFVDFVENELWGI